MYEELKKCPLCSSPYFNQHITCKDHFLTREEFSIVKCKECNFLFTNPRPGPDSIYKYYDSMAYISHSGKARNPVDFIYKIARNYTLHTKLKLINSISNERSLLDFGCGTGHFLGTCQKNNWETDGFEPDSGARAQAADRIKKHVYSNLDDLKKLSDVAVITLWHVLEHIPNLNETFKILQEILKPDGKFLIAVPNCQSFDAFHYQSYWAAYDVPRHLYHFTQETMHRYLDKFNLKIHRRIPMKLDAFYVSLLSEKYKHGKSNYLNSLINGYKSNSYAKRNDLNYSSIIYIAGK